MLPGPYLRERLSIDYTHYTHVSTLYPHHTTQGLVLPFGWTNIVLTKPIYCMTLSRPVRQIPLWSKSWVAPMLLWTSTGQRRGETNTVPNGDMISILTRAHKAYGCIPDRGNARTYPSLVGVTSERHDNRPH